MTREGECVAGGGAPAQPDGMASLLEARAVAYDFLKCALLQEPTETFVRLLIEGGVVQGFPFADERPECGEALRSIGGYLERPDVLSRRSCEELRWDYTRMFIGPGRPLAPPFESIYRDVERLHFSEETLAVREAYRRYGLVPREYGREPDDHLGLELDFMRRLCQMAAERIRRTDAGGAGEILADQEAFLEAHLFAWVPAWTGDVVRSAETDFYRGVAQLLGAYLPLDRELVIGLRAALRPEAPGPPGGLPPGGDGRGTGGG